MNTALKIGDTKIYEILKIAIAPDGEELFILQDETGSTTDQWGL